MTDIQQADIFFFITTIAVIVVTIAVIVITYYVVKIAQKIRRLIHIVEYEINQLSEKRRKVEVYSLTMQKVVGALMKGGLFRNRK